MKLWLDEQISPQLAPWITENFAVQAVAVRDLGLDRAKDREIFDAARKADAVVLTKDGDFVALLERFGPPPKLVWLTCGNTSNANLKRLLQRNLEPAIEALERCEPLVEID
jgi:predicted nuclease of predicted toxin-antitoxin system